MVSGAREDKYQHGKPARMRSQLRNVMKYLSGCLCLDDEAHEGNHREPPILDLLCLHLLWKHTDRLRCTPQCLNI